MKGANYPCVGIIRIRFNGYHLSSVKNTGTPSVYYYKVTNKFR